jgi:uracil-DNA glycosylase
MNQSIDIEQIKQKLYEKLEPSGWGRVLKMFIFSSDFDNILLQLAKQARDGKRFTPTLKQMFRAFEECPYSDLKVVIVGQDPYPQFGVADGIAFSCSNTGEEQPSLKYMLKAVNDTVYQNRESTEVDLKRWSNQGVLLLNTALSTNIGKVGQHYMLWRPFLAYLFDFLTWNNNGLVYIYMGKKALEWQGTVNDNNYKLTCSHPASAAYNQAESWDCNDVFNKTSKILKENYNFDIVW